MAMILSMIHRPFEHSASVYGGQWQNSLDFTYSLGPLTELRDKTLGVVGFGMIGRRVCELAAAFGMNVVAFNPSLRNKTRLDYLRFDWCTLEQAFRESDFVSLHCPLKEENVEFVNAALLKLMKPTAMLINTARGGLVNEADLAQALTNQQIAGACLDVVSEEPMQRDNPFACGSQLLDHSAHRVGDLRGADAVDEDNGKQHRGVFERAPDQRCELAFEIRPDGYAFSKKHPSSPSATKGDESTDRLATLLLQHSLQVFLSLKTLHSCFWFVQSTVDVQNCSAKLTEGVIRQCNVISQFLAVDVTQCVINRRDCFVKKRNVRIEFCDVFFVSQNVFVFAFGVFVGIQICGIRNAHLFQLVY